MEEHPDPSAPPPRPGEQGMDLIAPVTKAPAETLSRSFFWLSLRRAFRLDIKTDAIQKTANMPFKLSRQHYQMAIGMMFGMQALMVLGPKVISLMPGMIRASIVAKLQFPGATAPGWLMMLAAPVYALFAYIIVLL